MAVQGDPGDLHEEVAVEGDPGELREEVVEHRGDASGVVAKVMATVVKTGRSRWANFCWKRAKRLSQRSRITRK